MTGGERRVLAACLGAWAAQAAPEAETPSHSVAGCVNVMEYVLAVGTSDHTEAVKQAFAAAREPRRDEVRGRWSIGVVYFPPGRYRFGGEGAGYTPVVHKARGGKVVIEDSWLSALGNNRRPCVVYCEQMPDRLVIDDSPGTFNELVMLDPSIDPASYYDDVPLVTVPKVTLPGPVPDRMAALVAAAEARASADVDWGGKQLSEEWTSTWTGHRSLPGA